MSAICIAGMHRSGTSMIARLLNLCGLYLGEEGDLLPPMSDNPEGYWENRRFVAINDKMLAQMGAGWDYPDPLSEGWETRPEMKPLRVRAARLAKRFADRKSWGWKDPRNSITLPFWISLIPDMKVVICLRNPLDVAGSLLGRNYFSAGRSFDLWHSYNQRLLESAGALRPIVTHYDAYFHNPRTELRRVLRSMKLTVSKAAVERSLEIIDPPLRHHQSSLEDLVAAHAPQHVIALYEELCARAGPVYRLAPKGVAHVDAPVSQHMASALDSRGADLEARIVEKERVVQELTSQLAEKERVLGELTTQLAAKEQGLERLTGELAEREQLGQTLAARLAGKERALEMLSSQLSESESRGQGLEAELADRERSVRTLLSKVDGQERRLQQVDEHLTQTEKAAAALASELAERAQAAKTLASEVATERQAIESLRSQLAARDHELISYALSKSWRFTRPVRRVLRKLKAVRRSGP